MAQKREAHVGRGDRSRLMPSNFDDLNGRKLRVLMALRCHQTLSTLRAFKTWPNVTNPDQMAQPDETI